MWLTKAHTSQEAPTSTSGSSSPAPIWVPFIAVYTLIAIPALIIAEIKDKY